MANEKIPVVYQYENRNRMDRQLESDGCHNSCPYVVTDEKGNMLFTVYGPFAAIATEAAMKAFETGTHPRVGDIFERVPRNHSQDDED